ncbi:TolC family protein [Myroides odoratimimus]|uniref:TolC family protein n=1 Tax=Myroides odoratimimus TaxID=76832 RepID=UPI002575A6FC|nr:TolC family protein [Myroides odoratimimus]MDM1096912.1 TolC family protein [Myroides odoratimimus]MDM1326213.1 TolC family protein [Myroides odoratimimus]MDM1443010.1 TolC family protein [Myroides odoratimimus]MDM1448472.1 TolC family protein [Myroides odoratimimus]MDM1453548.1 TolC family protein [Myroides odoratimimus]
MFKNTLLTILSAFVLSTYAQDSSVKTLTLSKEEAEALFLEQNLELIAKNLEISQAEAQLLQAKLWPNPTFEVSEINFWKTTDIEEQPKLIGNWGEAQQYAFRVEQLIQTGGKRRKNIDLQKLTIEEKQQEFESIMRELKLELRNNLSNLQMLQEQQKIYEKQIESTKSLISAYKNQLDQGNISQAQYIRLKAAELQFKKELVNINKELEEAIKDFKNFVNIGNNTLVVVTDKLVAPEKEISELELENWIITAQEQRPDALKSKTLEKQSEKRLEIEKAQRVPDITLGVDYDRGGNIMRDFVGFGLSFDLPIFDRNKGGIKEAKIEIELAKLDTQTKLNEIANDIVEAFRNYYHAEQLYKEIETGYEQQLDQLLDAYLKNFQKRNVSLIEYLDFVEAYIENKTILLETKKDLHDHFEKLQYAVGKDL